MELQKFIPIIIILVFVILYTIYFTNRRSWSYDNIDRCAYEYECANICPTVPGTESELKQKLMKSFDRFDNESTIQISRIEIKCRIHEKRIADKSKDWRMRNSGTITKDGLYHDLHEYCLEFYDKSGTTKWEVVYCEANHILISISHQLLYFLTIILLIAPFLTYLLLPQLRDFHGKLCIILLGTQILMMLSLSMPSFYFEVSHLISSIFFMFIAFSILFSITAMCYDIYSTFKNFGDYPQERRWPLRFLIFVAVICTLSLIAMVISYFFRHDFHFIVGPLVFISVTTFIVLASLDVIMLIATLLFIVKLSKSTDTSMKTQFDIERERYWLYVKLFIILISNWLLTIDTFIAYDSFTSELLADVIKVYSAAVVTYLLLGKENVKVLLMDKYHGFNNESDERV